MATNRRNKKKGSSGIGHFVLGICVGAVSTALWFGLIQDRPTNIGSGIDGLIDAAQKRYEHEQSQGEPTQTSSRALPEIEFSFHELLLNSDYVPPSETADSAAKTAVAENTQQPDVTPTAAPQSAAQADESYVLQVGSFADFKSADRVKASLALNGLEAFIQKVTVEGQGDFYRVRLGPFVEFGEMQELVETLTRSGYQPLRFRLRQRG